MKKGLREREAELQSLLASPAGRAELQELYAAANDKRGPVGSAITYILIHERQQGRIK